MSDVPHDMPRKRQFNPGQDYLHKNFGGVMFVARHPHDKDVLIFETQDRDFIYFATVEEMIEE